MESAGKRKITEIPEKAAAKNYSSWQECYGDFLFMREQKIGAFDYETKITLANLVIEKGLSYEVSPNAYLAVIKYLAAIYNQTGQYERVLNDLLLLVQLQDENTIPCWVYHNYIDAELHVERTLSRIIRNPAKFLADLAQSSPEADDDIIRKRQQNLLKNLFREASFLIDSHRGISVALDVLSAAAEHYGVESTLEFTIFCKTIDGANPEALYKAATEEREALIAAAAVAEAQARETDNNNAQLQIMQEKLNSLEDIISQLTQANADLEKQKAETDRSMNELRAQYSQLESTLSSKDDSFEEEKRQLLQTTQSIATKLHQKEELIEAKNLLVRQISSEVTKLKMTIQEQKLQIEAAVILPPQLMVAKSMQALTEILYTFTKRTYPDLNNQRNWEQYVISAFGYEKLENEGLHRLEDFDAYTLLKLSTKRENWEYVKAQNRFDYTDKTLFYNALDARNHYAHFNTTDSISTFKRDLYDIQQLFGLIRIPHEFRPELAEYMSKHIENY